MPGPTGALALAIALRGFGRPRPGSRRGWAWLSVVGWVERGRGVRVVVDWFEWTDRSEWEVARRLIDRSRCGFVGRCWLPAWHYLPWQREEGPAAPRSSSRPATNNDDESPFIMERVAAAGICACVGLDWIDGMRRWRLSQTVCIHSHGRSMVESASAAEQKAGRRPTKGAFGSFREGKRSRDRRKR